MHIPAHLARYWRPEPTDAASPPPAPRPLPLPDHPGTRLRRAPGAAGADMRSAPYRIGVVMGVGIGVGIAVGIGLSSLLLRGRT